MAIRRCEQVHATDGVRGRVQRLVIDARNHHVTHVLLQEGHVWGRKEVAIPIGAVRAVDDGIQLNITKQEVKDPPLVARRSLELVGNDRLSRGTTPAGCVQVPCPRRDSKRGLEDGWRTK